MENLSTKKNKCGVYSLNYRIAWCPKRRSPVLVGQIAEDLKTLLQEGCGKLGVTIATLKITPEYVDIFVSSIPSLSPHKLVKRLKGASSNYLRKKYPQLLKLPALWSSSYFVGTVGIISESVIKLYLENQKGK